MNEERLQLVASLWYDTVINQAWNREGAKLRRCIKWVNHEVLTLTEVHRLLSEILSNQFFRKEMSNVFRKHDSQLRSTILKLESSLGRRKEVARAMRVFYLRPHQVICGGRDTIDCELGASDVKKTVEKAIDRYSYDMFSKAFDRSLLSPALEEIEETLESRVFMADCLRILVADFVAEANKSSASEIELRQATAQLIGMLVEAGYDPRDLKSLSTSMAFADGRSADDRFESVICSLTVDSRSYKVLTTLDDVSLTGDDTYRIGNVTFCGEKYDISGLLDKMPQELNEIKQSLVTQFWNKTIAETLVNAFGDEQAKDIASQEIAKAIDILSFEDPQITIREPNEEKRSRQIILDDQARYVGQSFVNRLELSRKVLSSSTRSKTDKILAMLDVALKKPSKQLTDFERRILTGMHFYRKGNSAFSNRDKVVNYIVSLESMLVMSGEHPSTTLPKRVLDVIGVSKEYRTEVRRLMKYAYRHRGEILHLGVADERESERFSREMSALNRRLLSIMLRFIDKPECKTLREFLEFLEKETIARREDMLKTAILDINKEYFGNGVLKHSDGSEIGDVSFTFSYKDDGRYVYMLGSVTSLKLRGTITDDPHCYIEGTLDGNAGVFRLDISIPYGSFGLIELTLKKVSTLAFRVRTISRA